MREDVPHIQTVHQHVWLQGQRTGRYAEGSEDGSNYEKHTYHYVCRERYYPLFFGKYEKEKKSTSSGSSGGGRNSSVTISTQKEEIYESKDFASLEPGEFIGMGNRSNIKGHFRKKFRLFELEEEPLPVVAFRTEKEISDNYTRILKDIERVLGMEEIDVNSLFTDR